MALVVKNPLANKGDIRDRSLILGSGKTPGGGNGNPLQYSFYLFFNWRVICLQNFVVCCQTSTWDGWMASRTRWTWVWVNSGRWWWTGRPDVLRFLGSQRVGHNCVTELNWTELIHISPLFWTSFPPSSPSHPSRVIQNPVWVSWAMQQIPIDYLFYIC